jgi:hypothetical protein
MRLGILPNVLGDESLRRDPRAEHFTEAAAVRGILASPSVSRIIPHSANYPKNAGYLGSSSSHVPSDHISGTSLGSRRSSSHKLFGANQLERPAHFGIGAVPREFSGLAIAAATTTSASNRLLTHGVVGSYGMEREAVMAVSAGEKIPQ